MAITTEELLQQYIRTLKAYQTPVKMAAGGLQIGDVVIPKASAVLGRSSIRQR